MWYMLNYDAVNLCLYVWNLHNVSVNKNKGIDPCDFTESTEVIILES